MKNLKSINEFFGFGKKSKRSDKEEKILQKAISMIEDTDKIESGEYKVKKPLYTKGKDGSGKASYSLANKDEDEKIQIFYNESNLTIYLNGEFLAKISLTKDEVLSISEKFEKAYEIQQAPKREKYKKDKEEKIDKFLNL